jgi:hypothetical protein
MNNDDGSVFWIVVGVISLAVAGSCVTVAILLGTPKVMWGLLLMPILWASHKDHKNKNKNKNKGIKQ